MAIEFCKHDNALLKKIFINGALKKVCKCYNRISEITPLDSLIFERYIRSQVSNNISTKLLQNVANDPISTIIDKPCKMCNAPFIKLFISDDLCTNFMICKCQFT